MVNRALLESTTITTAVTSTSTAVALPDNVTRITLQCKFVYGSGGTAAKVYVQTSFDRGSTWVDIACFAHTTASLTRLYALNCFSSSITDIYTATDGSLADDTAKKGLVGDRLRVKYVTTGTYAGSTTLQVDAQYIFEEDN
jgi:hypothetical protein